MGRRGSVQGLTQMRVPQNFTHRVAVLRFFNNGGHFLPECSVAKVEQALARSQQGPMVGKPFHCSRRQQRLVWTRSVFASFSCAASGARSPSRPPSAGVASHLTSRGHHLGRRGFPLESCAARICRGYPPTSGSWTSTSCQEASWMTVGLPLFHGAQLAIDTTLVSPVRADGAPRRQCATRDTPS